MPVPTFYLTDYEFAGDGSESGCLLPTPLRLAKSRLRRLLAARACGRSTTSWSPSLYEGGKRGGTDSPNVF